MKQKGFKKLVGALLITTMVAGMFGCGEKNEEKTNTADTQQQDNVPASSEEEKHQEERENVEISWYVPLGSVKAGANQVEEVVKEYVQEKLNITLDLHFVTKSDYSTILPNLLTASGDADIVFINGSQFMSYVDANAFQPLEDYIDECLPQTKDILPEASWSAYAKDGHFYAVPPMKDLAARWGFLLNQNILDDLEVEFPETFETAWEVLDFVYEVKEARDAKYPEKAKNPIMAGTFGNDSQWYQYEDFGSGLAANVPGTSKGFEGMGDGETVFCRYMTEEYREMAKAIRQMVVDGISSSEGSSYDPDNALLSSGELLGGLTLGYVYVDENMFGEQVKMVHYPASSSLLTTAYVQNGALAITRQCEYPERALELLELVNTDEYLATTLRFGVEGDGWTDEDNDGIIERGPLNEDAANTYWWNWYGYEFGNILASKLPDNYPAEFSELLIELNETSLAASNLGFVLDTTSIANEVAACANVIDQYNQGLMNGQQDNVDELCDEFEEKLIENGMEKIIEEAQRQLTEFRIASGLSTK